MSVSFLEEEALYTYNINIYDRLDRTKFRKIEIFSENRRSSALVGGDFRVHNPNMYEKTYIKGVFYENSG
jgi:hypothetical protein